MALKITAHELNGWLQSKPIAKCGFPEPAFNSASGIQSIAILIWYLIYIRNKKAFDNFPIIIGLSGSVAIGKTYFAEQLAQHLSSCAPDHITDARGRPSIEIIATDGFLMSNSALSERGISNRKGFPESYRSGKLLKTIDLIRNKKWPIYVPMYSHITKDTIKGKYRKVKNGDIIILEGVNILSQTVAENRVIADILDITIALDAELDLIEKWYIARGITSWKIAQNTVQSWYSRNYPKLNELELRALLKKIWEDINQKLYFEEIVPNLWRSDVVLNKRTSHEISHIRINNTYKN